MKVKMLINMAASYGCPLREGEVGDVEDTLGKVLVDNKWAVLTDEPDLIRAVPSKPAIAEAAPKLSKKATGKPAGKPQIKEESDG